MNSKGLMEINSACYYNKSYNFYFHRFIDIDVATLYLCLRESICRSDFCYLHQNRFPGRSLCYIDDSAFVVVSAAVVVGTVNVAVIAIVVAVVGTVDYPSILGNHVVVLCLHLMVSFCLFSD
jgi:hypothetical protein